MGAGVEGCFKAVALANVLLIALVSWRTSPITCWSVCEQNNWCFVVILLNSLFNNLLLGYGEFLLSLCKHSLHIELNVILICVVQLLQVFSHLCIYLNALHVRFLLWNFYFFRGILVSAVTDTNQMSFKRRDYLFLMKQPLGTLNMLSHYI